MARITSKEYWKAAGVRAWHAFWECAVPLIPVDVSITAIDWKVVAGVSLGAAVLSLAKSFAKGMPEVEG